MTDELVIVRQRPVRQKEPCLESWNNEYSWRLSPPFLMLQAT
jgi:hypothetical protein